MRGYGTYVVGTELRSGQLHQEFGTQVCDPSTRQWQCKVPTELLQTPVLEVPDPTVSLNNSNCSKQHPWINSVYREAVGIPWTAATGFFNKH